MRSIRVVALLAATMALGTGLAGCEGDDGKDGLTGPTGPAGGAGATGPAGPTGPAGTSETAGRPQPGGSLLVRRVQPWRRGNRRLRRHQQAAVRGERQRRHGRRAQPVESRQPGAARHDQRPGRGRLGQQRRRAQRGGGGRDRGRRQDRRGQGGVLRREHAGEDQLSGRRRVAGHAHVHAQRPGRGGGQRGRAQRRLHDRPRGLDQRHRRAQRFRQPDRGHGELPGVQWQSRGAAGRGCTHLWPERHGGAGPRARVRRRGTRQPFRPRHAAGSQRGRRAGPHQPGGTGGHAHRRPRAPRTTR